MTVRELIEKLKAMPPDSTVLICDYMEGEFEPDCVRAATANKVPRKVQSILGGFRDVMIWDLAEDGVISVVVIE